MHIRVEANECSGVMLTAMNSLFNHILIQDTTDSNAGGDIVHGQRPQYEFYPKLYYALADDWAFSSRFNSERIDLADLSHIQKWLRYQQSLRSSPDISVNLDTSEEVSNNGGSLTVQSGDFVSLYSSSHAVNSFDIVVTSFFIDTVLDSLLIYITNIYRVLKPSGFWINTGPLHYHRAGGVPYSFEHVEELIILTGFEVIESRIIETDYCGEYMSVMKPEFYRIPLTIYRKQPVHSRAALSVTDMSAILDQLRSIDAAETRSKNY